MQPSLEDAVERARRGDPHAFETIVEVYGTPLCRFVARIIGGDGHAAHDVVQEAFVAAWRALPRLSNPAHLKAWLFQVAYRHAVTWLRRHRGPRGDWVVGLSDDARRVADARSAPADPADAPGPAWRVEGRRRTAEEVAPPFATRSPPSHRATSRR